MARIGVISDTHDLLRPEAVAFLRGCDHIVHAGDVCGPAVLEGLRRIALLTVVRGNNDRGAWAESIPVRAVLGVEGVRLYVVHDVADIDIDPAAEGIQVVITGHSHRPAMLERQGVVYLNPGSAGPRRFRLPISIGEVVVEGGRAIARTTSLIDDA